MRLIAIFLLGAGLAVPGLAFDGNSCGVQKSCAQVSKDTCVVVNSCRNLCPVAVSATTMGRSIVVAMPVAIVDRGELEA